jgi:hypothetical protein
MADVTATFSSIGEFERASCLTTSLYMRVYASFSSIGEFERASCLTTRLGTWYASFSSIGEFERNACSLQCVISNILKVYTQPITAYLDETQPITAYLNT